MAKNPGHPFYLSKNCGGKLCSQANIDRRQNLLSVVAHATTHKEIEIAICHKHGVQKLFSTAVMVLGTFPWFWLRLYRHRILTVWVSRVNCAGVAAPLALQGVRLSDSLQIDARFILPVLCRSQNVSGGDERNLAAQHRSLEEGLQSPRANKTNAFLAVIGARNTPETQNRPCHYSRTKIPARKRLLRCVLMKSQMNPSVSKTMQFSFSCISGKPDSPDECQHQWFWIM